MIELSTAEYFQTLKHVSIEYDVSWYIQEHLSSNCEQSMKMILMIFEYFRYFVPF